MHTLFIKPLAEKDATTSACWYNVQREGLGDEFLLCLEATLFAIRRNPKQFGLIYKNVRRALTQRFPFGVFYIIEKKTVIVLAILHTSRNPKLWDKRNRLKDG